VSFSADALFDLLPAVHRIRDIEFALSEPLLTPAEIAVLAALEAKAQPLTRAEAQTLSDLKKKRQRGPLASLLAVIAEQVAALEENLDQLYDDQFIETCAEWVAPYIGDLIGYRTLHGVVPGVASPRAEVANTIRFRRRKGTAAMLEQLARDVTGWPARAVEFFERLGCTQYMNHRRPGAHYAPDLRQWRKLNWRDTAFDGVQHTVDVRRVATGAGRYNILNVGLFLWRIRALPLTRSPVPAETLDPAGRLTRFNPLGGDAPLFTKAETEDEVTHLAEPMNVPLPIGRRWLSAHLGDYYGSGKSLLLELAGASPGDPPQAIPVSRIRVCDLSDVRDGGGNVVGWTHVPPAGSEKVAVDPVLGRIAFADAPARQVLATFHYGCPAPIGGGEYERGTPSETFDTVRQVAGGAPLQPELEAVKNGGAVEILDSGRYAGTPSITVNAGKTVALRAANEARPLLAASGDITLDLAEEATLVIDGLVISGGTLKLAAAPNNKPRTLILRHCTLVPGRKLPGGGQPPGADEPGLVIAHPFAKVEIDRCLLGPLHVVSGAGVSISNSVVDATDSHLVAYRGPTGDLAAGGGLSIGDSTIIGKVHASEITLASNTIFVSALATAGETWKAPVWADRKQSGCMRFSYVPAGSRTPRRYRCQPEDGGPPVRPHFSSLRFGDPAYCQLLQATPDAIRRGADDESEMGVLHGLYQPQRETNLRVRLDEYLRFGLEAGIFYAS